MMFIMPVIVLFWQDNGLSLTQIMLLQSIFAISLFLFEVPTGVRAVKFSRKMSMTLGAVFLFLGALSYSLGHNFWQFAGAEVIWGIGCTFISGADSAFVYDSLKQEKKEKEFKRVYGNAESIGYFAVGFSAIAGGLIAVYSLRLNWILTAFSMIILFFIALSFKEPRGYTKTKERAYLKHVWSSLKKIAHNRTLIFLFLFNCLFVTIGKISLWFYQPYMKASGLPLIYFGIVWASFNVFAIIGSKSSNKLEEILKEKGSLLLIILSVTLSLIFMSYFFVMFGIIFILLQQFIRGFSSPVLLDYTNKLIDSKKRATILSMQSMGGNLGFAVVGPLFGYIADVFSLEKALLVTGISFLIMFGLLFVWKNIKR